MGEIISSYIFPHPPVVVPEVGRGARRDAQKTIDSMEKASAEIKKDQPTTVILTTPHGPMMRDSIFVNCNPVLKGDLSRFRAGEVRLEYENNLELVEKIKQNAEQKKIYCSDQNSEAVKRYGFSTDLDHGAVVPLYFVNREYNNFKLVHISTAWLTFDDLYTFGTCIKKAVQDSNEKAVLLASGDLSHRLSHDAPYGFSSNGKKFDELLVKSVGESDVDTLVNLEESFCESAGECGLRSFLIMYGAIKDYSIKPEIYSYEGPYGVGYAVARIEVGYSE